MCTTSLPTEYSGQVFTAPLAAGDDAITAYGPGSVTVIQQCVFDFRGCPQDQQDEVIDGVSGAVLRLQGCVILGGIKAMLAGNGDNPGSDVRYANWELENCVIIGSGRRCPEAQDGTAVTMRRCWIHNWGRAFDVRAFGAWAHRGALITAEDCLFTQSSFWGLGLRNTLADLGNHIGQAVNDDGLAALLRPRTYLPGVCRGLTASTGGQTLATRCYRNRPWIKIDGCNNYIGRADARRIVEQIEAICPDMTERLGQPLTDFFDVATA